MQVYTRFSDLVFGFLPPGPKDPKGAEYHLDTKDTFAINVNNHCIARETVDQQISLISYTKVLPYDTRSFCDVRPEST